MNITPQEALVRCIEHREIFPDEMNALFRQMMTGEISPVMIAALTMGLRVKKETVGEIASAAKVLQEVATKVEVKDPENLLDIVGTGGDGAKTFNISTASMFVCGAAGVRVAKHGSRSVSSSSGSSDVLQALGVQIDLTPQEIAKTIEKTNIGFMFAPNHHQAMKHVAKVRAELGVRTIFNILGPLANPAGAKRTLMGVFHPDLVGIQVRVLKEMGAKRALVVWGKDNLDEISLGAATLVGELKDGKVTEYEIHPEDFGITMHASRNFKVENAQDSKQMLLDALSGKNEIASDIVSLNAGAALYLADKASSIAEGITLARDIILSGKALQKLQSFISYTNQVKHG